MSCLNVIKHTLHQKKAIPFAEFMQMALYTPNLGYYNSASQKFGIHGDFITAPELTPLFGQTIARQCQQVLSHLTHPILFEFGAGSGQLCVDILGHLEHLDSLPDAYHILEISGHLQKRQRNLITTKIPHLLSKIKWLKQWPAKPFTGVIIANEVLDAMPVHRFLQTKDQLLESYIALNEVGALDEQFIPCTNPRLLSHVQQVLPKEHYPYLSEANLFIDDWLTQCHTMLLSGALFILDYGFPRHEYYHPDRHQGTLMCHHHHQAHANFLAHPGEIDITAHVDFTHVAEAAFSAGFQVSGYTNQASFLLGNGLLSLLETIMDEHEKINSQQAVKKLLHPHEMGELFKIIALTKNLRKPLNGFQLQDKRASLSL